MPLEQLPFPMPGWRDVLEVLIVAYVVYALLRFLVGTRALQIVFGLLVLAGIYLGAFLLKLSMITYLLGVVFTYGVFAALVVFQPELRQALARLGQTPVFRLFGAGPGPAVAHEIAKAAERLSRTATGAIIAVEREVRLDAYLESGTAIRATVSADLLATIFSPYSPLHDGAVLVRGGEIVGAGCILPLTQNPIGDRSLGTRHRAALGLSEETDALVLVVSEESAIVSLARAGRLEGGLSAEQMSAALVGGRT
ncbi:MAG TPA: diadenylate cyclase CdaA [Gemmatimonadales bacterium]|nr:diadenylate cyclase CdaA [Gemmatimonadales bacterium]